MSTRENNTTSLLQILEAYTKGLASLTDSIETLKSAMAKLPEGDQRTALGQKIAEAEHSLKLGNAQIGQSLGFQLCQCTWPHQVMTSTGYSEEDQLEQFTCPNCGTSRSVTRPSQPAGTVTAFDPYDDY